MNPGFFGQTTVPSAKWWREFHRYANTPDRVTLRFSLAGMHTFWSYMKIGDTRP